MSGSMSVPGPVEICHCADSHWHAALDLLIKVFAGEGFVAPEIAAQGFKRERLEHAGIVLTATEGDSVLGTVMLLRCGSPLSQVAREGEAEVRMLAVDPASRARGIGEKLVRACVHQAAHPPLSARAVVLWTQPCMKSAQKLYERLGFHREPSRDRRQPPSREHPGVELERWAYVLPLR